MLKSATAAVLLSSAFALGTAHAQTAPQPGAPAGTQSPAGAATQNPAAGAAGMQYITENRQDLWRASQLDGVNVYNEQNERIGDITEVLLNKQGQVEAVVIGVGGFLGIGQRDVAVPFDRLQWQMVGAANVATAPGTATPGQTTAQPGSTQPAPGTTGTGTMTDRTATTAQLNDRPERAVLRGATKDQLQNAPEFQFGR